MHELAHAVHHVWSSLAYYNCESIVKETWARGITWYFVRKQYSQADFEKSWKYKVGTYTGLVEDLVQKGFTIQQVQTAVMSSLKPYRPVTTWDSLKSKVQEQHIIDNATIDSLFDKWR